MLYITLLRTANMEFCNYRMRNVNRMPDEQRLLYSVLCNYDTASRPVYNASHTVTVKFGFTLTQISDMVRWRAWNDWQMFGDIVSYPWPFFISWVTQCANFTFKKALIWHWVSRQSRHIGIPSSPRKMHRGKLPALAVVHYPLSSVRLYVQQF